MNSLFSSFDANGMLNWVVPLLGPVLMICPSYWVVKGNLNQFLHSLISAVYSDIKILFSEGGGFVFISLFTSVFMMNFLGLFPYIFTSTSHICISLGLGLPLWLGSQLVFWIFHSEAGFSHLVPEGSPSGLIPLLVLIELISNLIRPLTLSVRLMANMVAGHLLLSLIGGGASLDSLMIVMLVLFGLFMMLMLELGVSLIQSYVFMLLSALYVKDTL
uniref:ATP synthase subunit a n=1 Tax=Caligus rogercresseyi TaxID=217165 RepID=E1B2P4_CALRO|nr:ATP synthase F0 subunit 6 [Caligus rogercresseyi]